MKRSGSSSHSYACQGTGYTGPWLDCRGLCLQGRVEIAWWTGSKSVDIRSSRDQVITAIKRALDAEGIEIPFPYRTLVFKDEDENLTVGTPRS